LHAFCSRAPPPPPRSTLSLHDALPICATVEHPLRSNAVHTITRENTGPNIGYRLPIVHWEFVEDWDGLDVKCVPKGSGSENMSLDRKSTRLNSSHGSISYAVFCLKKKT